MAPASAPRGVKPGENKPSTKPGVWKVHHRIRGSGSRSARSSVREVRQRRAAPTQFFSKRTCQDIEHKQRNQHVGIRDRRRCVDAQDCSDARRRSARAVAGSNNATAYQPIPKRQRTALPKSSRSAEQRLPALAVNGYADDVRHPRCKQQDRKRRQYAEEMPITAVRRCQRRRRVYGQRSVCRAARSPCSSVSRREITCSRACPETRAEARGSRVRILLTCQSTSPPQKCEIGSVAMAAHLNASQTGLPVHVARSLEEGPARLR